MPMHQVIWPHVAAELAMLNAICHLSSVTIAHAA